MFCCRASLSYILKGNKHMHSLTSSGKYELRIDLRYPSNRKKYAVYKTFVVGDAASKYKLTVGDFSGTAGNKMLSKKDYLRSKMYYRMLE